MGITTLLIEPGRFRTKLLSAGNMKAVPSKIPEYEISSKDKMEGLAAENQAQPDLLAYKRVRLLCPPNVHAPDIYVEVGT